MKCKITISSNLQLTEREDGKKRRITFLQFQIIPMERTCSWTVKGFVSLYLCDSPGVYCISEVLSLGNNILWVRWKATISLGGAWQVLRFSSGCKAPGKVQV